MTNGNSIVGAKGEMPKKRKPDNKVTQLVFKLKYLDVVFNFQL